MNNLAAEQEAVNSVQDPIPVEEKLPQHSSKKRKIRIVVICTLILAFFMFLQILPFYLSFVESLQPETYRPGGKVNFWPDKISLKNYAIAWQGSNLTMGIVWSLIYAGGYTAITVLIISLVAYVLAKKKFFGQRFVFLFFMSALMVPGEILLVSNYLLITEMGLLGNPLAVILPGLVNIFGIFLLKQFMHTIPDSIVESAVLDGAGDMKILIHLIIPMSMPAIATYCIITFVGQWNEYLWPQLALNSVSPFDPIQIKLLMYRPTINGSENHPYASVLRVAATMITLLPVLVFYFAFQKHFTEGINISGLK